MRRLVATAAFLLAMAGCSSGLDRPVKEVTATTGSDNVQHVTIEAHSFYFEPNRIVVKKGIPVELTVKNTATFVPHDFTCEAQESGVNVDVPVGMFRGKKNVRFTPTAVGEFDFFCDVDGHAKKGMKGTLVVKD